MEKIDRPLGLIRYASKDEIDKKEKFRFTTRMKAYSGVLLLLLLISAVLLITRKEFDATFSRMRGTTYQEQSDGTISNFFTIGLVNKSFQSFNPEIRLLSPANGTLKIIGTQSSLEGGESEEVNVLVSLPQDMVQSHKTNIKLGVFKGDKLMKESEMVFFGPME